MYKLAVIDDELLSIKNIVKIIQESALPISEIITAENGLEALDKFKVFIPDIILVDIRMPEMDGLELIEQVKTKVNCLVKSIIVSGYDSFDYSKQALSLKVNDYILKPIKESELIEALDKTIKEIENERYQEKYKYTLKEAIYEKSIDNLIEKNIYDVNVIKDILSLEEINAYKYYVAVIKIINSPTSSISKINNTIKSVCAAVLKNVVSYFCYAKDINICALIVAKSDVVSYSDHFTQIISRLNELNFNISIGIGPRKRKLAELSDSYKEALKASNEFLIQGPNKLFLFNEPSQNANADNIYIALKNDLKLMEQYINIGSNKYGEILMSILEPHNYSTFYSWEKTFKYLLVFFQGLFNANELKQDLIGKFDEVNRKCNSTRCLVNWLIINVNQLVDLIKLKRSECLAYDFQKIINHLDKNYNSDEFSLEQLASMAYMNPTYFCEVFKKRTGKTYIEYLNDLRINAAKELLKNTKLKVIEVSEQVGYKTPEYFMKLFKRKTGLTPTRFRRLSK